MISEKTISGKDVSELSTQSKELVVRTCDNCEKKDIVALRNITVSRWKRKSTIDYCRDCGRKYGQQTRVNKRAYESHGYIYRQDGEKRIFEHVEVMEKMIGRKLLEHEVIHHDDGIKSNNLPTNLTLMYNQKEHMRVHNELEQCAFELFKRGVIKFNKQYKNYYIDYSTLYNTMEVSLGFENIAIQQQKNICNSRLDTNIESEIIKGVFRPVPLIASNMSTVINADFYKKLYKLGAFGVLHRADTKDNILSSIRDVAKECEWVAASIGIEDDQYEFAQEMIKNGCNIIVIDVAHGFSDKIINLAKKIKIHNPDVKVVVGNTTTIDLLLETYEFVDGIKVGIANGMACETKNTAGCNEKQFSSVLKFKELSKRFGIPIISDGGIREPADFTKAIAAGANSVMAGSIFAACPESAAELIQYNDKPKKVYAGMASEYVQNAWKGGLKPGTIAEGGIRYLDPGEPVEMIITKYSGALRSGITYGGAKDIKSFQENVKFIRIV